ncbi:MAG: hypothetical protein GEU90_04065 [Gemmatimonas sp.]|nr:hypothetical protein [Gemmatimonas sp.]
MNPDEVEEPIIEEDYVWGPNQPTRTIGLSTSFTLPHGIQVSARGEYMGGHFINDNGVRTVTQSCSRMADVLQRLPVDRDR